MHLDQKEFITAHYKDYYVKNQDYYTEEQFDKLCPYEQYKLIVHDLKDGHTSDISFRELFEEVFMLGVEWQHQRTMQILGKKNEST